MLVSKERNQLMSYNPHELAFQKALLEVNRLTSLKKQMVSSIRDVKNLTLLTQQQMLNEENLHNSSCIDSMVTEKESLIQKLDSINQSIKSTDFAVHNSRSKQKEIKASVGTKLNPLNWFNNAQKSLKSDLSYWRNYEIEQLDRCQRLQASKQSVQDKIDDMNSRISRYHSFRQTMQDYTDTLSEHKSSLLEYEKNLASLEIELKQSTNRLNAIQTKYQLVNTALIPILRQIDDAYQEIEIATHKLDEAVAFEVELTDAKSPKARKMIHQRCEHHLGDSSPSKVRDKQLLAIDGLQRTLKKLHNRATRIGFVASLEISDIAIDGNNLMNEGDKFIGLDAIDMLIRHLSPNFSVHLFFDPGATGVLQMTSQELLQHFPSDISVHITAGAADETILNYSKEQFFVVISRDSFTEYQEKPVVSEGRVFKPQLINGKLMINELGVEFDY